MSVDNLAAATRSPPFAQSAGARERTAGRCSLTACDRPWTWTERPVRRYRRGSVSGLFSDSGRSDRSVLSLAPAVPTVTLSYVGVSQDAAGAIRSAGWWESVTVTCSAAPAPDRRPAVLQQALATAADMIAPVLADVAVTGTRHLLQRRNRRLLIASLFRRPLVSAGRELPRSARTP